MRDRFERKRSAVRRTWRTSRHAATKSDIRWCHVRSGDGMDAKLLGLTWRDLLGSAMAVDLRTKRRRSMTHQNPEDCVVPEGRRKSPPTHCDSSDGGGKAVPVERVSHEQRLSFATTESLRTNRSAEPGQPKDLFLAPPTEVSKAKDKSQPVTATLNVSYDDVLERGLWKAHFADRGLVTLRDRADACQCRSRAARRCSGLSRGREPAGGGES